VCVSNAFGLESPKHSLQRLNFDLISKPQREDGAEDLSFSRRIWHCERFRIVGRCDGDAKSVPLFPTRSHSLCGLSSCNPRFQHLRAASEMRGQASYKAMDAGRGSPSVRDGDWKKEQAGADSHEFHHAIARCRAYNGRSTRSIVPIPMITDARFLNYRSL
jgi:hypothetical protein